jgi:catechol 2,3-dioxygenase-like lactoylglutathione lyase family enzyme
MLEIKRAGHSTLTTPDIERMTDYFTRIVGLSLAAREKNRVILATKSGLEAIVLERGSAVAAPRLSFQVAPGSDLGEVAARLKKAGLKSERRSDITPGIGEALAFTDPKGTTLEIFSDFAFAPEDDTFTGVMPLKFGHIAYQCPDVQGTVKFYCDVLGFRVSDWRSDFFAFLRCSRDHHTVNFLRNTRTFVSHIAFEVARLVGHQAGMRSARAQQYQADLEADPPHHRSQHRHLSQQSRRGRDRIILRYGSDIRRGAWLLRTAALAPGPAAAAEGLEQ